MKANNLRQPEQNGVIKNKTCGPMHPSAWVRGMNKV